MTEFSILHREGKKASKYVDHFLEQIFGKKISNLPKSFLRFQTINRKCCIAVAISPKDDWWFLESCVQWKMVSNFLLRSFQTSGWERSQNSEWIARITNSHTMEIYEFFCHLDFTWNQLGNDFSSEFFEKISWNRLI